MAAGTSTLLAGPAHAAASAAASPRPAQEWLAFSVQGSDESTRLFTAGVPGGGTMVSLFQQPEQVNGASPKPRTLTLTIDGEAVAAGAATLVDGTMVPSAGAELEQKQSGDTTTVKVKVTGKASTLFLLPEQAPLAPDPDDQGALTKAWNTVIGFFLGFNDDEDETSTDGNADEQDADEQDADEQDADEQRPQEEPSSAAPTSAPEPSSTQRADEQDGADPQEPEADETATSSATASPTASAQDEEAGSGTDQDSDTCVTTQSEKDSSEVQDQQAEDYAVSDGPSAAPTFSEETRRKAAARASDCGEPGQAGSEDSEDGQDSEAAASPSSSTSTAAGVTRAAIKAGDWLSGASGDTGAIGQLRGTPTEIATTWANGGDNGINVPQLQPGGEYAEDKWNKSLIISVSPFEEGGSWAAAAAGEYDEKWKQQLTNIKKGWGERDGIPFISLGWEMNGSWFAWSVTAGETEQFKQAAERYRKLQKQIMPQALLTATLNRESNGYDGNSADLLEKGVWDVYGVDYYNHYPYAATREEFDAGLDELDGGGGPKGLAAHQQVAKSLGIPMVLPEWNGSGKNGDSPGFFEGMYDFFSSNAGSGPGQVLAETIFEIDKDENNWKLTGGTKMPKSAQQYAQLWSDVGAGSSSTDEASTSAQG
ncbi:hypothetical protein [Kineococcus sp. SYSU DK006]|uniref:hypothetical protein n=1 Tax=Kineococcus sp. SYSU DK006 TaxID=3383127 RepID=UPI003D7EA2C9